MFKSTKTNLLKLKFSLTKLDFQCFKVLYNFHFNKKQYINNNKNHAIKSFKSSLPDNQIIK